MDPHYLTPLFSPSSVAVFGASDREDAVGAVVFKNLLEAGFDGPVYPINPKHETVQGHPAFADLAALGKPVELAVIATPAKTAPGIMRACGEHGVKAVIVMTAGFHETGPQGARLEQQLQDYAQQYGIRFLGPNCLGIIRPGRGLNATFSNGGAVAGNLALVSQSGALCTAILDWAQNNRIGFSTVVSTGMAADVDFGDVLDFLVADPSTKAILLYIEGIYDARSFMSALRAAARIKPVIAVKVGRHESGTQAVMSHTGALVGGDDVFSAALERSGVVRVGTIGQLFAAARTLASRYKTVGDRMAVVTNGGGPAVMAADRAGDLRLPMAKLGEATKRELDQALPATWSHGNPVDIIGDATPERYRTATAICLQDEGVDGVVVILTPQAMTRPTEVAQGMIDLAGDIQKPLLTCWMGGRQVSAGRELFGDAKLPAFATPEAAVDGFYYLASYHRNQQLLRQTPDSFSRHREPDVEGARMMIEAALSEQRQVLNEPESMAVLGAFHIPAVRNGIARSAGEALILAESIGFPVVMKVFSPDISHKSDCGGVRLNISSAQLVRSAYREILEQVGKNASNARIEGVTVEKMHHSANARELMVGIVNDAVFGPVISFGIGGAHVEVIGDRAVALPPLNHSLAENLIERTRAAKLLGRFRQLPPVDRGALVEVLLRISEMACELPWIKELDINPLLVDETGPVALDARMRVDFAHPSTDRYAHMAIHPYPAHLMIQTQLGDGTNIVIRPIRPEDAELEKQFIENLSDESKYFRFMNALHQLTPEMLVRFTQIDYDREMALIVTTDSGGDEEELAVARYMMNPDGRSCEFAAVVSDRWQRRGIAHKLLFHLMEVARDRGLEVMEGEILTNNYKMLDLVRSIGFKTQRDAEDPGITRAWRLL